MQRAGEPTDVAHDNRAAATSPEAAPLAAVTPDGRQITLRLFWILAAVATALVMLSGGLYVAKTLDPDATSLAHMAFPLFDVATENNIPTWYNASLWLLLAITAVLVAAHAPRYRASWILLAGVASYASIDEFTMLHERMSHIGSRIGDALPVDIFSYRWVLAGLVIVLLVALLLSPLMMLVPRQILVGYLIAGALFLLGAVVVETIGGFTERHFGKVTWHLMLLIQIEEWLEMVGVALAVAVTAAMIRWERTEHGVSTGFTGYRR